jgi:DNA-binding TFAR19-related protein (PDSD5 family)
MKDIDEIREQKRKELKESRNDESQQETEDGADTNSQQSLENMLKNKVDDDGRKRINAVEMADQERAQQARRVLLNLYQRKGRKITEDEVKEVLKEINDQEDDSYNIRRR